MSAFPYNTASPPPTAGPLPVIERANLNTPYATGGGGGVSPVGISTAEVAGITGQLNLIGDENTYIRMDGGNSTMFLVAGASSGQVTVNGNFLVPLPNVAEIQGNLVVSSINGAAPGGGGGGPNPTVSSITLGGSLPAINAVSSAIYFNANGLDFTSSMMAIAYSNDAAPAPLAGTGWTEFAVTTPGQGGALEISADTQGNAVIFTQSTIYFECQNTVIPSLTVSSINGAAPGGGGSASFSTLYSGSSTISCDAAVTTALLNFDTTIGHVYQIQTQMTVQGNGGQEGTLDDDVVQEVVNQLFLNATQGSFISTANAAARDVNIGTSGMWKATQGSQALAISGTFSTQVLLTGVSLLDFGAI